MKKSIEKISVLIMVMLCLFGTYLYAMNPEFLVGEVPQSSFSNGTRIIIGALTALMPLVIIFIAVIRLIINLVKIKKIDNTAEKSKKKKHTLIELCIWITILFLVFSLIPLINIYVSLNARI